MGNQCRLQLGIRQKWIQHKIFIKKQQMKYFSSKMPTGLYLELYFYFFVLTITFNYISSKLFNCDVANFVDYIYVAQIQPMRGDVSQTIFRSIGQRSRPHELFEFCGWGGGI